MNRRWNRAWLVVLGASALLGAGVAAGCGAAGIGLGSLGVALVAGLAWLALAATASTGCSSRGTAGPCLSPVLSDDAGAAEVRLEPCLQQPLPYVGPCLEQAVEPAEDAVGPCLKELPLEQTCLLIAPFCLSPDYHNMDAGESPDAAAPPPEVCLEFMPPEPCLSIVPPTPPCLSPPRGPTPSEKTSSAAGATAAGERLAAAGVLSPEQLRRLARLRGEG
jgi:hypothetical protein